jgi:hypothetical protein
MTATSGILAALPAMELLGCVIGATMLTEVMLWAWAYRHNSFKSLKVWPSSPYLHLNKVSNVLAHH